MISRIRIESDKKKGGFAKNVYINDFDVSKSVNHIEIEIHPAKLPRVIMSFIANVEVDFDAEIFGITPLAKGTEE